MTEGGGEGRYLKDTDVQSPSPAQGQKEFEHNYHQNNSLSYVRGIHICIFQDYHSRYPTLKAAAEERELRLVRECLQCCADVPEETLLFASFGALNIRKLCLRRHRLRCRQWFVFPEKVSNHQPGAAIGRVSEKCPVHVYIILIVCVCVCRCVQRDEIWLRYCTYSWCLN